MSAFKYVLGIDPGLNGAWALLDYETRALRVTSEMPRTTRGTKNAIDIYRLAHKLDEWMADVRFAVLEDVGAMAYTDKSGKRRGQGAAASFAFGYSTGVVQGVLASYNVPIYFVRPSVWKIQMGLSGDKSKSLKLAKELFPSHSEAFSRKKDDGIAEASLLALFGAQKFK